MLRLALPFTALLAPAVPALSESYAQIDPGDRGRVEAHGVCKQVTNGNPDPVMIPLSTPEEWSAGGRSFLAEPRIGMTVEPCDLDIWAWEYLNGEFVVWQGDQDTRYPAGGLRIDTRFTQYDGSPSSHLLSSGPPPTCGPGKGGERVTFIQGTPGVAAVFAQYVCNNATPVDPFSFPDVTVPASGYWTSPEITLSGIPHDRTEQLVVGVVGTGWSDPNGGCCSFNYDSRIRVNGGARFSGFSIPIGFPTEPYVSDFIAAYEPAVSEGGGGTGPSMAVAARNGDRIQLRMRATRDPGVTLTYFVKIGQHITFFDVTTT